jgi:hypothetical protein
MLLLQLQNQHQLSDRYTISPLLSRFLAHQRWHAAASSCHSAAHTVQRTQQQHDSMKLICLP